MRHTVFVKKQLHQGRPSTELRQMSIYKYLSKKEIQPQLQLPSPNGVLRGVVPPMAILSMNKGVEKVMSASTTEGQSVTGKREPYVKLMASQKALIGKKATEQVVTSALHHFKTQNSWVRFEENNSKKIQERILGWTEEKKMWGGFWACDGVPSKKEGDLPC